MRAAVFAAVLSLVCFASANAAPIEAYGQLPTLSQVSLSPDGSKFAYVVEDKAGKLVIVQSSNGGAPLGGIKADAAKIRDIRWIDEGHLIVVSSQTSRAIDIMGPRQEYFEAVVYDIEKNRQSNLMSLAGNGRAMNVVVDYPRVRIVDGKPVVFSQGIYFPESKGRIGVYAIDPQYFTSRLVVGAFANATDYLIDGNGRLVAEEDYGDRRARWTLRLKVGSDWKDIAAQDIGADTPSIMGFSNDGSAIIVRTYEKGDTVVRAYSVSDGSEVPADKMDDGTGDPVLDRLSGRIVGFRHLRHNVEYEFVNPNEQAAWKKILALFPHEQVELVSASDDRKVIVVQVTGVRHGYGYFLVHTDTDTSSFLGPAYNGITYADMGEVEPLLYAASDGRQLDAYLTLPPHRDPKSLPLIVFPHGGPAARDEPGFDWWAQAMASLGYAVLQPQFRGSEGYGWDLLSAGFGQWGHKMQTDLSDGVRALARTGIIDPKRVCIVGGSYGGYAALAGAAIDTGVYRCAVSVAGVSDMREMMQWKEDRSRDENLLDRYWLRYTGATSKDDPALDVISPIKHIDKITIPVLLIHGKDDTVVPFAQSEDMVDAMRKAGKNVSFVQLDGEDHWLSRSATRQAMLKATADFLKANNPP